MSKKLIIAEKPSVATDISRALGGFTRQGDYFESDDFVLSSAVGHLLEITEPEAFQVKRGKWTFNHLPVIPDYFELKPIEKNVARLKVLTKLIKRKDVVGLINACDAGREGELIFDHVRRHSKTKKPVERLWLQSMTPQAIREGFQKLRSGDDMRGLCDAAISRSEADWLVGINGTRAMTAFNSKTGGFHLTTVGRVQTPTLSILVEREERIRKFVARDYWEVEATFQAKDGEYTGRWFDESFDKAKAGEHDKPERLWDSAQADNLVARCQGHPGEVHDESRPTSQQSPLLYDLTSLQREANSRFGFPAKMTLGLAQALYEKHKALTYPRTDSRYLPEDYLATVTTTLIALSDNDNYVLHARRIADAGWVKPNKRIFDNAKVSDHFAIIPTPNAPKSLSEPEQKLYDLVVRRFLAIFHPAAEFLETVRITRVEGSPFRTAGKVLVQPGWLVVYGRESERGEDRLPAVAAGERPVADPVTVKSCQTRPPARLNEATLLSAMEGAGKLVDDDELRSAMGKKGLGTPATRAQIIENLISEQYVLREGKELIPTAKAHSLLILLRGLDVPQLTSPELTGEWEWKLSRMERGELARDAFMHEIAEMTRTIVDRAKAYDSDTIPGDFGLLSSPCPKCGGLMRETYKKFQCADCDYALWKIVAGRQYEASEIEALLRDGRIGPLDGFRNKMGRPFSAAIKLNDELLPTFDFGDRDDSDQEAPDFSDQTSLGACPKCAAGVFETERAYVCEKSVGPGKKCDFRSGKVILQQAVDRSQMEKLLSQGKTDLLRDFVSARTRRKFSAFLVRQKDGKVGFEFEPREKKPAGKARAKTSLAG